MRITIRPGGPLRRGRPPPKGTADRVQEAVTRVAPAAAVRPTHPDTASPDLQAHLEVDVDPAHSQRVLTDLR
jgi:hypothetical protein